MPLAQIATLIIFGIAIVGFGGWAIYVLFIKGKAKFNKDMSALATIRFIRKYNQEEAYRLGREYLAKKKGGK